MNASAVSVMVEAAEAEVEIERAPPLPAVHVHDLKVIPSRENEVIVLLISNTPPEPVARVIFAMVQPANVRVVEEETEKSGVELTMNPSMREWITNNEPELTVMRGDECE